MKITWLGHSAFRVDAGKSVIMIDPFISANGKYKGTMEEASQGATHVLLTHGHDAVSYTHLEVYKRQVMAALLWYMHRANISRLLDGTEGKIGKKG